MPAEPSRAEFKYFIERQKEEIRTLTEVSRLLTTAADAQEVIQRVARYLHQVFPVSLCGILLLDQKALLLFQFSKISPPDASSAIGQICSRADKDFPSPLQPGELKQRMEDLSGGPGLRSEAAGFLRSSTFAPMVFNGKPMGRLALFSAKPNAFSKEDEHVLAVVAEQLAAVLHAALLMDELRQADLMKDELLAVISHELRIPLTTIQEGTRLLTEGALGAVSPEQQDFLKTVLRNSERLQGLIEEVELASKLITGRISYSFDAVPLAEMLQQVAERFLPVAQSKGVLFSLDSSGPAVPLWADGKRLPQALEHLVENAVQATAQGGTVTLGASDSSDHVVIRVTDTGQGIPAEMMPKLFSKFFTVGGISDRKTGGLGLGLFTAKKIIEAHQGQLQMESQAGQGTRVTVRLPRPPR